MLPFFLYGYSISKPARVEVFTIFNLVLNFYSFSKGIRFVSNGSVPGAVPQIRIRGNHTLTTSISSGDNLDGPLYVEDGIPYGGTLDLTTQLLYN